MHTLVNRLKARRDDCLCVVALVIAAAIFLAEALQSGHTLLPLGLERGIAPWYKQVSLPNENLLLSDPFYVFYPRRHFLFEALQNGHFPLWMPDILNGHPLVGDVLAQIFYPPNILTALFMSAGRSLPFLAWFHLIVTGVALYGFLRVLRLPPVPALFGALAWMLNGNMVVWLENPYRLSTLCWLPVVFLAYESGLRRRQLWPTLLGGLCYGVAILGGHVQFALCIGGALGVYAVIHTLMDSHEEGHFVSRPLTDAVMIGIIGAGIGAVQLLPMLELTSLSHRTSATLEGWLQSKLPLMHLVGLWLPDFFGHPVRYDYGSYWGSANYAEITAYYGALALPLSLFATLKSRQKPGKIFGVFLLLMLLIVLGSPLVTLLGWIPWMRYVRLRNLLALVPFFGSIAAAFGLHTLFQDTVDRKKPWVLLLVLILLAGFTVWVRFDNQSKATENWADIAPQLWRLAALWGMGLLALLLWSRPRLGQLLWVLALTMDLLQWGMIFNPAPSMDYLYPENEVTTWLKQDPGLYRVLPLQTSRVIFGPDVLSVFNLHETGGYSSLMLKRTQELVHTLGEPSGISWMRNNANVVGTSQFDPKFSMLNVKYVLTMDDMSDAVISSEVAYTGCVGTLPLSPEAHTLQRFTTHNPGLNRIDVEFTRTDGPAAETPLRFLLWRGEEGGELLADITVEADKIPGQGTYSFYFQSVANAIGETFVWAIEVPETTNIALCQAAGASASQSAFSAYSIQLRKANILQGTWIYENPNVLPRAYVVHKAEIVQTDALLGRLAAPDFNPWTTVLLEAPLPDEQQAALAQAGEARSTAEIVDYQAETVKIQATMQAAGILVLSDTYYPGWHAWIDGEPASVLQVNYTLRGLYVPEGSHEITYRFRPTSFYVGLALTGLTLLIGLGAVALTIHRSYTWLRSNSSLG